QQHQQHRHRRRQRMTPHPPPPTHPRLIRPSDPIATVPGVVLGTPAYMSPEQARGEPAGPPSDVYSLGLILFELLTGGRPFAGSERELLARLAALSGPIHHLIPETLDAPLRAVLGRALAPDLTERYASMADLAADLESLCQPAAPARKA